MNILLINSPGWAVDTPPYNLALLKAVLKDRGYQVTCLDLNKEIYDRVDDEFKKEGWASTGTGNQWLDRDFVLRFMEKHRPFIDGFISKVMYINPDVIGFSVINRSAPFALELAKIIKERKPGQIIILGGSYCYRYLSGLDLIRDPAVDAVCLGEGEICFGHLLDIIDKTKEVGFCKGFVYKNKDKEIIDCGDPDIIEDLDSLSFADFSDFDVEKYNSRALPILISKGCIYKCSFCNESIFMQKFRTRTGTHVYSEIAFQLHKYPYINSFHFNVSLINGDIKMLNELCDLIIINNIHINWSAQASIRKEMTKDFLTKLKSAGCHTLMYGIENGSNKILKLMNKQFTAELAEEVLRNTYEAGIRPNFNIIIGFPGETEIEFQESINFVKRNLAFSQIIALNILSISKGSDLDINKDKWGIRYQVPDWESFDGKNNYNERLRRLEIYKTIIKDKAYTDAKSISLLAKLRQQSVK